MRKIVLVVFSVLFALVSYSQDISTTALKGNYGNAKTFDVSTNDTYRYFYGNEISDTISNNDTIWYREYIIDNLYDALKHELRVELDSVSGTPTLNVALKGKYSYNDAWTSIANADWAGTSSDTVIALVNGTAKPYRFLQVYIDADTTAQKAQIERIELGIYK